MNTSLCIWAIRILHMKNAYRKKYEKIIQKDEHTIELHTPNLTENAVCQKKLCVTKTHYFFCENTQENVNQLLKNWDSFCNQINTIYFVNIKIGSFWAINPANHTKITSEQKRKKGIQSLYVNSL